MIGRFALGAAFAALASSFAAGESATWPHLWRVQAETKDIGVFHGVGVVTAIDAASGALTLDHEEIKGLMPAMAMMYRVKSRDVGEGLRVGDTIAFDLDGKSYTIVGAKRLSPGDAGNK